MRNCISIFIISLIMFSVNCSNDSNDPAPTWQEHPSNPIIDSNWSAWFDLLINDPCVIKEGSTYRMWFSKGTGLGINIVRIYQGTSDDGINWNLSDTVLLEPTNSDAIATGSTTPTVYGTYGLLGELTEHHENNRPVFELSTGGWFLWYDDDEMVENYRITETRGDVGTRGWLGDGGTKVDGNYTPYGATCSGTLTITTEWDSEKIETPMVVHDGTEYHMYYSGLKIGAGAKYQIGHATSPDGTNWTKDPVNNPVIEYQDADPESWDYFLVGEPAVIYENNTFYLYYSTNKYRGPGYSDDLSAIQGICLATSSDGSAFTFQQAVLTQSDNYPVTENYRGYSTPFVMKDSIGKYHLFYDVAAYPSPGDWTQVALAHAVSDNPTDFTEIEYDIFVNRQGDWMDHEVRAPSVIEEDGYFKMWFAGDNGRAWEPGIWIWAIGYATKQIE